MRIFKNFIEAEGEIKRDLKEMGVKVQNTHMQDKMGSFPTVELINYGYTVLKPSVDHINIPNPQWLKEEWQDRVKGIKGNPVNPGSGYFTRRDGHIVWEDMLEYNGKPIPSGKTIDDMVELEPEAGEDPPRFAYTYSERFALGDQVYNVIRELRRNKESRQLYISLWDPLVDSGRLGKRRVPCSLGWHFLYREGTLNITYTMRSCDFVTHWANDVVLSMYLLGTVVSRTGLPLGKFSHFINSFHVYEKDVADVF